MDFTMEPRSQFELSVGEAVRVIAADAWGHCRTPRYLRGKVGRIRKLQGYFRNPESLAYGGAGLPLLPLYQVEFEQTELWTNYQGAPTDKLLADLYHHWLERIIQDRSDEQ